MRSPASPDTLRRRTAMLGLLLAPWCWAVTNTAYMLAIRDGGSDEDGAATLALMAAHPSLTRVALTGVAIGGILVIPAISGFYRLAGERRSVVVGGGMMAAGYVCYAVINGAGFEQLAMAQSGHSAAEYAQAIDAGMSDPWAVWPFAVFVLGNLVGTLVLAFGLWRSRFLPIWVPAAIASWPVLHVIGLAFFGNEIPQVIGAVLQAVAFGWCAIRLRRAQPPEGRAYSANQAAYASNV